MTAALSLSREQIVAFRRRSGGLDKRLLPGPDGLRRAAWAGLQDSVPRSALHALHARVEAVDANAWEDPALVQVWGLRYAASVVPEGDHAPFTLGRLNPESPIGRRAEALAARLAVALDGHRVDARDAGRALGTSANMIRYATLTGTVFIRWDGARQPFVWTVPRPEVEPLDARLELARRYLHTYAVGTAETFAKWAGLKPGPAARAFDALASSLQPVRTPIGDAHCLAADEQMLREARGATAGARLLPSGDPFYLLWGAERELLVEDPAHRSALWTTRVWPGAMLVDGEIAGTWRRSGAVVSVQPWRRLALAEREAVEREAATLPLPEVHGANAVRWDVS